MDDDDDERQVEMCVCTERGASTVKKFDKNARVQDDTD
jgi:hypothetical protein